jgi:hypothetical protein
VYVDLSGWHLFLRDMTATPGLKMNHALAQQLGPQVRPLQPPGYHIGVKLLFTPSSFVVVSELTATFIV